MPADAQFQKIRFIINPVSGVDNNTEQAVRAAMRGHDDIAWDIYLTQGNGDAKTSAEEARAAGYDLVFAAGGDGTMREAAEGLIGGDVPLCILPTGTANVLSVELGFPKDIPTIINAILSGACRMQAIDAVTMDNKTMLLRAGIGYEAEVSVGASREAKSRFGRLAYFVTAWRKLRGLRPTRYYLTIDGEDIVRYGVTCLICNSANVGLPNVRLVNSADINDGKLDVILVSSLQLPRLVRGLWHITFGAGRHNTDTINHWQAETVSVRTKGRQVMAIDGDYHKRGERTTATIIPSALRVVVPT